MIYICVFIALSAVAQIQKHEKPLDAGAIVKGRDKLRKFVDAATAAKDERTRSIDADTAKNAAMGKQIKAKLNAIRAQQAEIEVHVLNQLIYINIDISADKRIEIIFA